MRRYTRGIVGRIGVLALQGDFHKHVESLHRLDPQLEVSRVRDPEELATVDRLIIPGGESTTVGMLMQRTGLDQAIPAAVAERQLAVWGTCMGMILMASDIENSDQPRLGLLNITVRRNAFGAQVHSFEDQVEMEEVDEPVLGVFIRAPIVTRVGEGVKVLASYQNEIVAVRQGTLLGTSFHPELTSDLSVHRYFLNLTS